MDSYFFVFFTTTLISLKRIFPTNRPVILLVHTQIYGARSVKLLKALRYKQAASGSFPGGAIELILLAVMGSTLPLREISTTNISLKVKAVGVKGWELATFRCRLYRKYGRVKLLQPSGSVQVCTGIALTSLIYTYMWPRLMQAWQQHYEFKPR